MIKNLLLLTIAVLFYVKQVNGIDNCLQTVSDFLGESTSPTIYDDLIPLAQSTVSAFGPAQNFIVSVLPTLIEMATPNSNLKDECMLTLGQAISQAIINERGTTIATGVKTIAETIRDKLGVASVSQNKQAGHLYKNGYKSKDYCTKLQTGLDLVKTEIEDILFVENNNANAQTIKLGNQAYLFNAPLYVEAFSMYKTLLSLQLGCASEKLQSEVTGDEISHERHMANEYEVAMLKIDRLLEKFSASKIDERLDEIKCTEACNGSCNSDCTCACTVSQYGGTTAQQRREYSVQCRDHATNWVKNGSWNCVINSQSYCSWNMGALGCWATGWKKQCFSHGGITCDDPARKETERLSTGVEDYRSDVSNAIKVWKHKLNQIKDSLDCELGKLLENVSTRNHFKVHYGLNAFPHYNIYAYGENCLTKCKNDDSCKGLTIYNNLWYQCYNWTSRPSNAILANHSEGVYVGESDMSLSGKWSIMVKHDTCDKTPEKWYIYYDYSYSYAVEYAGRMGVDCMIACENDKTCLGLQFYSNQQHQCYKLTSTPLAPNRVAEPYSEFDHSKPGKWSVFFKASGLDYTKTENVLPGGGWCPYQTAGSGTCSGLTHEQCSNIAALKCTGDDDCLRYIVRRNILGGHDDYALYNSSCNGAPISDNHWNMYVKPTINGRRKTKTMNKSVRLMNEQRRNVSEDIEDHELAPINIEEVTAEIPSETEWQIFLEHQFIAAKADKEIKENQP